MLVAEVGLVSRLVAQQANHEFAGLPRPRIGQSVTLRGKLFLRAEGRPNESRNQQGFRRRQWQHQAKPDRLDKAARVFERAHGGAVEAPLLAAKFDKFGVGHKNKLSAISCRPSGKVTCYSALMDPIPLQETSMPGKIFLTADG